MYVYQEGKLYTQNGDKLVGVEIYSDKVLSVEGSETELGEDYQLLTPFEVQCRFGIIDGNSYIFPKEEVVKNEPTTTTKRTTRKSK